MKSEEIVIFSNPVVSNSDKPICVIRFDGNNFTIHAVDERTAKKFEARIKLSPAWEKFADNANVLSSYLTTTFGHIVVSRSRNQLSKENVISALSKMKFKIAFDYNAKISMEDRLKNLKLRSLSKKIPALGNYGDDKPK